MTIVTAIRYSCFLLLLALASCASRHDSLKIAKEVNDRSVMIDSDISDFVVEMTDTRRFLIELATAAEENSSSPAIEEYSRQLIADQSEMLKQLSTIAASKKITLPLSLSKAKYRMLEDLQHRAGGDFDKKFIKHLIHEQRHNLREFEKATVFKDRYVRFFAKNYIDLIQMHLTAIENIRDGKTRPSGSDITIVSNQ